MVADHARPRPWKRFFAPTLLGPLLLLTSVAMTPALAQPPKRVLAIHSYNPGDAWQESLDRGLESALSRSGGEIQLFHEYMDTLRKTDPGLQPALFDYLRAAYKNLRPDVLVASDRDALSFLLNYRDWLFGPLPVVFVGVDDFTSSMLLGQPGYTGVVEGLDMGATLEAVLRLRPQTRRLAVFGANTTTFFINVDLLTRTLKEKNLPLELDVHANLPFPQVLGLVKDLGQDSVVVVLSPILDEQRNLMPVERSAKSLSEVSSVPLVSFWEFLLGQGTLGGRLVSGQEQGRVAGELALRILSGEPADKIPVVTESPNRYIFDYVQMERFGLTAQRLPQGAVLLNLPDPVISRYRNLALGGLSLVLVLGGVITLLATNIARRRRAEEALRASEELFSKAFKNSPAWVAISTLDEGRYLEVNDAFTAMSGYTREEVLGRTSSEMGFWVDPDDRSRALEKLELEGGLRGIEVSMVFKDGREHQLIWSADTTEFSGRRCLINVLWDISDMRLAQKERDQMESQLRQAQKMEALGTLAGGIAHDFNNILGGILGFTELAQREAAPDSRQQKHLEQVLAGCQRARDLVKQILTFSRRHETTRRPILAAKVAEEMVRLLRATLPTSIEIKTSLESRAVVMADPTELHLLLLNLCTNAAQAMEKAGGVLSLGLEDQIIDAGRAALKPGLAPGAYLAIKVADTGPGIEGQTMARIFDPFFSTKGARGTGLGLSVAHGIAQSLGGAIEVESVPGQGACFTVLIPRVQAEPSAEGGGGLDIPTGRERLLLVDDEEALVEIGGQLLTSLGYTVESFSDSREAQRRILAEPRSFDLLITDLTMPGLSGRELTESFWQSKPELPVLVLTGYAQSDEGRDITARGPALVLNKPLGLKELAAAVRQALALVAK